jgi:hypothetical protein
VDHQEGAVDGVAMSETTHAEGQVRSDRHESLAEQIERRRLEPIQSVDELRDDEIWESDEELQEFLDQLYESRRSGMG